MYKFFNNLNAPLTNLKRELKDHDKGQQRIRHQSWAQVVKDPTWYQEGELEADNS